MINHILTEIVYGVNWAVICEVIFGVAILGVVTRYFGLSSIHITRFLIEEIGKTVRSKDVTRTSIDGVLTSALSFFFIYRPIISIHELGSTVSLLQTGVEREGQAPILFIFMVFWTSIVGVVSLLITGGPNGVAARSFYPLGLRALFIPEPHSPPAAGTVRGASGAGQIRPTPAKIGDANAFRGSLLFRQGRLVFDATPLADGRRCR